MSRKLIGAALGLFGVMLFAGTAFVPASSASPGSLAMQRNPSGLTANSIDIARESGMPGDRVAMSPQSSLKLLARATKLGPHAPYAKIRLTVSLKLAHPAKLQQFLQQVQYPGSPLYHQWLTPQQAAARFGPTQAQVRIVTKWLKSRGIQVLDVTPNRLLIHTRASTRVYNHAFGIQINDYKLNGRHFYSTTNSPKLPRSLVGLVQNVIGLDKGVVMHPMHTAMKPMPSGNVSRGVSSRIPAPPPMSSAYFAPIQIANAYDVPDITDASHGAGVTIAILTALSPGLDTLSDPHDFWTAFGLPDHEVIVVPVGGASDSGGMGETLLDMDWSGAWAPGATLRVYVAADASFATFIDMYSLFQTDDAAQVMTTSWGATEQGGTTQETQESIFALAAAQGISMFAAAGDDGSGDGTGGDNACDYPSASLYITAASGTELEADIEGNRISEVASTDTGGAICTLDQPSWQVGAGVPQNGKRNTGDMALNYGGIWPYLIWLSNGPSGAGWYGTGGTSAVAPQLAGLFAVAVSQNNGARLGQSNKLIYDLVNAGHYATDFFDVTSGSNGAYSAGPDWDHPTGWGTPNATSLISHLGIQGPRGMLSGTVTIATASGSVLAGAIVEATGPGTSPDSYQATSGADGGYSLVLPVGSYSVMASAVGYGSVTVSTSIADGTTTTEDFALQAVPMATLSGTVTDGSGHGYGLYADIKVSTAEFGQVAEVWTDPATGEYSVELPEGATYTLDVSAAFDGYNVGTGMVALADFKALQTQNFALTVSATCTAPGYEFAVGGFSQDFNSSTFPPAGWTVTNPVSGNVVWMLASQLPTDTENYTGGTGDAASADANALNGSSSSGGPYDTSLVTPPIPVTSLHGATVLKYKANYSNLGDAFDLDISADGGATWVNVLHWTTDHGALLATPGVDVQQDLAGYLPSSGSFQLRWRFYGTGWNWYAQIDDVSTGGCAPIPGGLLTGQVTDAQSGEGIVGATVTDDLGTSMTTVANPDDPNLPVGSYLFFTTDGARTLTVTKGNYTPATVQVNLPANGIVAQSFALSGAKFETNPDSLSMHIMAGNSATASFAVSNVGDVDGTYKIKGVNAPPPTSAAVTGPFAMAPRYVPGTNLEALMASNARPHPTGIAKPVLNPHAAGDVVASFPAGIAIYGLGADHNTNNLWLGSPAYGGLGGDNMDHRFLIDGTDTGDAIDVANTSVSYMADIAFNDNTGMIWQASVDEPSGSTGHIYEFDPVTLQPTGNSILIPSPQSERGLAYNPITNTWYAGDFNSTTVYHFDASGTLLDSANVALSITGLAYNASTGHLFVLTSAGAHAIFVLDANNGYAQLGSFDISGFDPANSGAGLGYTCAGNLVVSDYTNKVVFLVDSGETGWCDHKGIPWATTTPAQGTLAVGASATITVDFDGAEQEPFTVSRAYLKVDGGLGAPPIVPLTVFWDPLPVNLNVSGAVSPSGTVEAGDNLTYTITVQNLPSAGGAATQTMLSYAIPEGVNYLASSGNGGVTCTLPPPAPNPTGFTGAPITASVVGPATVTCNLGKLAPNSGKLVTISVHATAAADTVSATFTAQAREPDSDTGDNTLTLSTNPNTGPAGPTGPQGPKGDTGSGGLGFGGLALLALLALSVGMVETRRRRRQQD